MLLASAGPGRAQQGPVVAELELTVPTTSPFVLRGTFPVPKGTFPRPDKLEPFALLDHDGTPVPTQVEIVSRYPLDADGADVVEVLGQVHVPPGAGGEMRLTYQVVELPHSKGSVSLTPEMLGLISAPSSVLLVARDCFGHQYSVDVLDGLRATFSGTPTKTKVIRRGKGAVTLRGYGVMKPDASAPVGPPSGALAHLFGVHSYATVWATGNALSLDLRVNNAASGLDQQTLDDDPLGDAYFEAIELWVPTGWTLVPDFEDPFWGVTRDEGAWTAFELVAPLSGGELHMMPALSSFHRRLALTPVGNESVANSLVSEEWLGFNRRGTAPGGAELYSWWNPATPGYFPQKHRLAELDYLGSKTLQAVVGHYVQARDVLRSGQATGNYPYISDVLGWAHPLGEAYGGVTGGGGIYYYDGFMTAEVGVAIGYKAAQIDHRMAVSRQADKLYDLSGEPTNVESLVMNGSFGTYVNMSFFQRLLPGSPDPFGLTTSPGYQRSYVQSAGLQPQYEPQLLKHDPIDFQHYVRYTGPPKVLVWLGNDALAKDDLKAAAEIFRMSYHEHHTSPFGGTLVTGLRADMDTTSLHPGIGFTFARGESWGLESAVAAYATTYDASWRAKTRPWMELVADTVAQGQAACSGIIQSNDWTAKVGNAIGQYRNSQAIEQSITENMLYGLVASVFRDADPAREAMVDDVLSKSLTAAIGPMRWSTGSNGGVGPNALIAVAPIDLTQQPFCSLPSNGAGNGIDRYMPWSSFAYGLEKTGDPEFLNKADELASYYSTTGTLLTKIESMGLGFLHTQLALIADLQ